MKRLSLVDPLPENGILMIRIDNDSVLALKEVVNTHLSRGLGDTDDVDKQQLLKDLKDDLIELKDIFNPS